MSRDARIKKSEELLAKAEGFVASIAGGSSNVSIGSSRLSRLHQKLDDSIDSLNAKQQPCCPLLMKKLKAYRLFIKRWLENQKQSSPNPA